MVRTACPALVVFDGYRGRHDGDRTAAAGLTALLGCGDSTYWNNWSERGDSLKRRFDRASAWLKMRLGNITEVNVIGLSMGCQLAIRFVHHASIKAPSIEFGQLVLIAPDPKYRPVGRDAERDQDRNLLCLRRGCSTLGRQRAGWPTICIRAGGCSQPDGADQNRLLPKRRRSRVECQC